MFISVIPALKMPFGHCFFDYELNEGSVHVGDLILVPFRQKMIAALVAKKSTDSEYASRTISISNPKKIFKFPEVIVEYCVEAAKESFVSPPTMLNAWLRTMPKRLSDFEPHLMHKDTHRPKESERITDKYLVNRYTDRDGIIDLVAKEQANGRVLVITPWQRRVDFLAKRLGVDGLHAHTAMKTAWLAWTGFLNSSHGVLITTRLGAWLAGTADIVIVDEPENDDFKQDELTPRYDARRLVSLAAELRPELRIHNLSTTPVLSDYAKIKAPSGLEINTDATFIAYAKQIRSEIEHITQPALDLIAEAFEQKRPIRILHPVYGIRGRIRCGDCNWLMTCPNCKTGMNNMSTFALCRRCNTSQPLPTECPTCRGADLNKSVIGCPALQSLFNKKLPGADLAVLDLHEWQNQALRPQSLIVITNLMRIGGYSEDIRRKERMIIAFRRIAAQACVAKCSIAVQGDEALLAEAKQWLTTDGLIRAWKNEYDERRIFEYPPAVIAAKLIVPGDITKSSDTTDNLQKTCQRTGWKLRGPFTVEYRPMTREQRYIYHLIPPLDRQKHDIINDLSQLTAYGIIDLDPIAFFC
ncbi:MAG: hypothetical protein ACOYUZ_02420 [Patescibacteria group bacterium]